LEKIMTQLVRMGMTPGRFRSEEVSATEGAKWSRIMTEMSEVVTEMGPEGVKAENAKMRPQLEKRLARVREGLDAARVLDIFEARLQGIKTEVQQAYEREKKE
jgi:hypothetical protein